NPRRRDAGAVCHHGNCVGCRTAHATMVVAAHLVHRWTRSDGGVGASASKFVSLPCDLDIATLDTRYGIGFTDTVGRVGSNDWRRSPIFPRVECAAVGSRAFPYFIVARIAPHFFSGSKSRDRHLLWRPNI